MRKYFLTIFVFVAVGLFFGLADSVEALTCNQSNLFLSSTNEIGWGDIPNDLRWSAVSVAPAASIRLSLAGENGCAGRTANFQILNGTGGIAGQFNGVLKLGRRITGNKYQLYYDWSNNLSIGSGYKFKVRSLPLVAGFTQSVNVLNVEQINQACRLFNAVVVSPAPGGTIFGTPVGIKVTGQGCQGWGATMNIYKYFTIGVSRDTRQFITTLSEQKFSINNQLTFFWNPNENPGTGQILSYQAEAIAGIHKLDSNIFVVRSGTSNSNERLPVDGNKNQEVKTSDKKISLEFPNPLAVKDFTELVGTIQTWLFYLALPIAVIMIVVSGIIMMASGGDPGRFGQAKKMLLWAVVGLAVILIGEGFLKLIESIINLKNR